MAKPSWLLIDLLNEYKPKQFKYNTYEIISKKFWFIKWLVKNNKINEEELQFLWCDDMQIYYKDYERIIMMLSISNDPLKDLIKLLK